MRWTVLQRIDECWRRSRVVHAHLHTYTGSWEPPRICRMVIQEHSDWWTKQRPFWSRVHQYEIPDWYRRRCECFETEERGSRVSSRQIDAVTISATITCDSKPTQNRKNWALGNFRGSQGRSDVDRSSLWNLWSSDLALKADRLKMAYKLHHHNDEQ
jgi:hypothetical protein